MPPANRARGSNTGAYGSGITLAIADAIGDDARPGDRPASGAVGAEIAIGDGVMGIAAAERRMVRVAGVGAEIRYGHTIRERFADRQGRRDLAPEIPLPGLPDARAQLATVADTAIAVTVDALNAGTDLLPFAGD